MVEECAAVGGDLSAVEWYVVPDVNLVRYGQSRVAGYWSLATNRIVLAENEMFAGRSVRHEMLHALLQRPDHPRRFFLGACGGVAGCEDDLTCVQAAGPPSKTSASVPTVSSTDLEVSASISPVQPLTSFNNGFFILTLSVHNPAPHPVVVTLPGESEGRPVSYSYTVRGVTGGTLRELIAFDPGIKYFEAGEVKKQIFDFAIGPPGSQPFGTVFGRGTFGIALPSGTYTFRGAFGGHSASELTIALAE
jgi:hypothetical protein